MLGNYLVYILKKDHVTEKYFRGLYPSDNIHELERCQVIVVLVTIHFNNESVNHYVAYLREENIVEYFDSEGKCASFWGEGIIKYLSQLGHNYVSAVGNQNLQSPFYLMCGYYCIYYIRERCQGKCMVDVIKFLRMIEDERKRDHYVFEYVKKLELEISVQDLPSADAPHEKFSGIINVLLTAAKISEEMTALGINSVFLSFLTFVTIIIFLVAILIMVALPILLWIPKMDYEPMDVDIVDEFAMNSY